MKRITLEIVIALLLSLLLGMILDRTDAADDKRPIMRMMKPGDVFILQETGAVIVSADSNLKIDLIAPGDQRPEGYRAVDMKRDDEILMLNGKKLTSIKDLKDGYEALAIGAEVKLGIRRDRQLMIVSFVKCDPEKLPKREVRLSAPEGGGGGASFVTLGGADGKVAAFPDLGIIVKADGDRVIVAHVLPNAKENFQALSLKEGDEILELAGTKVVSVGDFELRYGKIAVGDFVALTLKQGDGTKQIKIKKPVGTSAPLIIEKRQSQ